MGLHAAGLRIDERPALWERLVEFFAARLPETEPELLALRERAVTAQEDARKANRIFDLHIPDGRGARQSRHLSNEITADRAEDM